MGTTGASIPLLDDHRQKKSSGGGGATSFQTLGNIMVSLLGSGVLGLPYAFRVSGSLALAAAAAAIYYCMLLLVGLCIALAFAFPMTIHPVNEIVENKLDSSEWIQKLWHKLPGGNLVGLEVVRVLIDVAVAFLSTSVSGFTAFIPFTGSTVCALLAFVLPSTFHLKLMGSSLTLWQRVLDSCILAIGLVFAGCSIYSAISGHPMGS